MGGKQLLVAVVHGGTLAVVRHADCLHKAGKPHLKQPLAGQLPLGKGVPQLAVDGVVGFAGGGIVGQVVLGQHIGQCLTLGGVKVQKRVVHVQ